MLDTNVGQNCTDTKTQMWDRTVLTLKHKCGTELY